ncbi:MAG: WYL domain-containing protein [Actinomycetota bacterium]|nr:WYL domain-containing protein [Rubrobacter sp.]MDQ3507597.1 WYL domain-containing protein [Actinomycetota bacterium]
MSLAAYLLYDGGNFRDEASIRRNLPLYGSVYEASLEKGGGELASDALRKQLARDVDALAGVGIRVVAEGASEGRRYSLPAEGFSPAEVELSVEERSVFAGALRALRRDFPYAGPLRLAIANMIGAVSTEADEAFAAIATRHDENVARRVAVLERAISRRKRVRFDYFSISRDETSTREVEPHSLSLVDGVWYVSGWDTNREAVRQFRMSRVRGLIKNATRKERGDFEPPEDSSRHSEPRAPWQLEEPEKTAHIKVSEETLDAAMHAYPGVVEKDGDDLVTGYSGERQLAGWTLSLGGEVVSPDSLKGRVIEGLEKIAEAHRDTV